MYFNYEMLQSESSLTLNWLIQNTIQFEACDTPNFSDLSNSNYKGFTITGLHQPDGSFRATHYQLIVLGGQ
jgi:hypothetical protein